MGGGYSVGPPSQPPAASAPPTQPAFAAHKPPTSPSYSQPSYAAHKPPTSPSYSQPSYASGGYDQGYASAYAQPAASSYSAPAPPQVPHPILALSVAHVKPSNGDTPADIPCWVCSGRHSSKPASNGSPLPAPLQGRALGASKRRQPPLRPLLRHPRSRPTCLCPPGQPPSLANRHSRCAQAPCCCPTSPTILLT